MYTPDEETLEMLKVLTNTNNVLRRLLVDSHRTFSIDETIETAEKMKPLKAEQDRIIPLLVERTGINFYDYENFFTWKSKDYGQRLMADEKTTGRLVSLSLDDSGRIISSSLPKETPDITWVTRPSEALQMLLQGKF